ncbi:MAG: M67 family metallopeptidase [Thermoproteota archaeon]|nr:M67 family metallopeptidase [Thermoproteota archaeon]
MMEQALVVTVGQINALKNLALCHWPYEVCSLLLGISRHYKFLVKELYHMRNVDQSETAFQMGLADLISAYKYSSEKKLNVIGVFHSHILGTAPSKKDLTYMELNPVVWLIYSVDECKFEAYKMDSTLEKVLINIVRG